MASGLDIVTKDFVAEVTINRPPVNALDRSTKHEIIDYFQSIVERADVRVAILTGQGTRAFCGGQDMKDLKQERSEPPSANIGDPMHLTRETFWAIRHCAVPVICAVNGPAVGAGLALVAVSDIAIASDTASFALTEIDVGVLGAASFAKWMVGPGKARRMMYTGERVPAHEVHRLGGVDAVVASDDLMAEARKLAGVIAAKSPTAMRLAKSSVVRTDTMPLEAAYQLEQDYTRHLSAYPESSSAINAFFGPRE